MSNEGVVIIKYSFGDGIEVASCDLMWQFVIAPFEWRRITQPNELTNHLAPLINLPFLPTKNHKTLFTDHNLVL